MYLASTRLLLDRIEFNRVTNSLLGLEHGRNMLALPNLNLFHRCRIMLKRVQVPMLKNILALPYYTFT